MTANVREVYLRVIDATIARTKDELLTGEESNDKLAATLDALRESWQNRLLKTTVFDEATEASLQAAQNGHKSNVKSNVKKIKVQQGARTANVQPTPPANVLYGGQQTAGEIGKPEQYLHPEKNTGTIQESAVNRIPQGDGPDDDPVDDPPSKRARIAPPSPTPVPKAPGQVEPAANQGAGPSNVGKEEASTSQGADGGKTGEGDALGADSDEDDSDLDSDSDNDAENFILAQHDRVKKGSGRWKVALKDGIVHVNGRDYLFGKGSCDLDW